MMTNQAAMAFLTFAIINAFTPGPGNILALNTITNYGWKKGKPLFFGVFTGYYVVQLLCALLIFGVNTWLNPVMDGMKYIGAAYILYLAFHVAKGKPVDVAVQKNASFWKGFTLQLVNVKIYFFGLTALSGYVVPYYSTLEWLVLFELFIASIGTVATLSWIFMGRVFNRVYLKHYRVINIILALILVECAWKMIFE
jgi:cysteine/O-acetylserine efflux protein